MNIEQVIDIGFCMILACKAVAAGKYWRCIFPAKSKQHLRTLHLFTHIIKKKKNLKSLKVDEMTHIQCQIRINLL